MTGDDPLLRWRDEFPILRRCTYLISNSLGAMPRAAYDALRQYADEWASEGVTAINDVESFWWLLAFPCGLLSVTLLCLNFLGDGLRDAFDPKTGGG